MHSLNAAAPGAVECAAASCAHTQALLSKVWLDASICASERERESSDQEVTAAVTSSVRLVLAIECALFEHESDCERATVETCRKLSRRVQVRLGNVRVLRSEGSTMANPCVSCNILSCTR